jgi:aspartate/methionine/tyrosine aminotransferase
MKKIEPFALERYFARHEFSARYLLSCSDCQALSLNALIGMADDEAMELWRNLTLGYTESPGHPLLRQSIAGLYTGMDADDILVTVPEEGIFLAMQALLEPGDHVVCTFPGYQSLYELARSIGCRVSLWKPDESRGWQFDVDQLEPQMEDTTRLVVINFPHNPTGATISPDDLNRLADTVRRRNIYLFCDEMYRFLEINSEEPLPAACDLYENAVSLGGLSKSFGLAGLRLGWLATRQAKILETISQLKDYTTICNSAPSEILGIMALRNRETIVAGHLARVKKNIGILAEFIRQHNDFFSWHPPRGGSICFPKMSSVGSTATFCRQLIEDTGIMLLPSRIFDYGDQHVRIGLGRDNLGDILTQLDDYLRRRK